MLHFTTPMPKPTRPTGIQRGKGVGEMIAVELTGDPTEIPKVRAAIRALADRNGFAGRASDLVLALDELVANAREHGELPISVHAWYDGRLVMTVSDGGAGFDIGSIVRDHPPVMLGKRGRGLWIIRQVTDHLTVETAPNFTCVRVELTHEPQIGA
jgi:anti-sigma regulatory factor (Ser/Thr protein kinase)